MKSLKGYLSEASGKNTHMKHIEDLVLDGGVKGAREAINALRSLRDMLAGNSKSSTDVTVKWDGAPAVFAGEDPRDGKFFVAKKGVFNADPKVYKSHDDIDADTQGDLNKKLKMAYDNLKDLGIKQVIQGDFMYDRGDLKKQKINGESYITFHPNTILYAVPVDSDLGKTIARSNIGIVWHTVYTGGSFENMSAQFGKSIVRTLKSSNKVWMIDATLDDMSGTAIMTASETTEVTKSLSNAGKIFNKISASTLKEIESEKELNLIINTYNNTKVRAGQRITNTKSHANGLIDFVNTRYSKAIDKLKTEKGKSRKANARDELIAKFFNKDNLKNLTMVFDLQNAIVDAKLALINKLNTLSNIDTFVKTKDGFKVTNPEGFVAIDRIGGGAVKLVDRLEFSSNNFSKDIIKGWDSPTR
tara:strand:+ start:553 stop:1800 length:1248 start_codon:yes stop_codon:yes gene_type:complete